MEKIFARVKTLLLTPEEALSQMKTEEMDVTQTMKEYVTILAAVPAGATFIGLFGHVPFFRNLFFSALIYAVGLIGVFAFGKIIDALAAQFNSIKSDVNAFKLALCAFTPAFVAGIFTINPNLSLLWFLGSLYGVYILYLGLPILMETPENKRIVYTAVNTIIIYILMLVLIRIASAVALGYWWNTLR